MDNGYKHLDTARTYRNLCKKAPEETSYQVVLEQSDLYIISTRDLRSPVLDRLSIVRREIKGYIILYPEFASSLVPVQVEDNSPEIVKSMAEAAELFGVGPMAAVAGAISQDIAHYAAGLCRDIIVENGGDIFLYSGRDRVVGLLPHPEEPACLGIKVLKDETPCAICSSSATIGHSLSLGKGDLVTVRAGSGAVADAAATALCNMLHSRKSMTALKKIRPELEKKGITGVLAQMGEELIVWGNMELTMV
jgi:uncharacterized protein